ncbi:unnamed protein product [Trichogramma brassicae]|uniref:Uncharacterized protein n=1 Tax=Trichogramma brassicae TaxID=86971 RepID=A0A6H5I696_9HYME|nr:unnamed protein product [Trichogramma brassicae]
MIQYDLEPRPASGVPKEKVCDETPIELDVEAKGQWPLMRTMSSSDILPPLPTTSLLMKASTKIQNDHQLNNNESRWLSQVEIFTHAGPHRRLWMGPQFVFKTYNTPSGVATNLVEAETVEVGVASGSRPARSNPVNMPHSGNRPLVPVVIDGSGSSYEQSPRFVEAYSDALDHETPSTFNSSGAGDDVGAGGENQLREDLAEAMLETSSMPHQSTVLPMCRRSAVRSNHQNASSSSSEHRVIGQPVAKVVNPLGTVITLSVNEEDDTMMQHQLQQQQQDVDEELAALLSSSSSSSTISSAVCAQEGKNPVPQEQPESQALKERTSICAEMRPAEEPAAIDSVPDDRIKELKEQRQLCAEAAVTSTCCAVDLDRVGAFKDVPSSPIVCAERGAVPDCSNVIQTSVVHALPRSKPPPPPPQSEATRQSVADNLAFRLFSASPKNKQVQTSNETIVLKAAACVSSDDDIEHVDSEELPAIAEPALADRPTAAHSSDDDLEHIRHSDIPANQKSSKEKFSPTPARTPEADAATLSSNEVKTKEATPERQTHRMQLKQKKQKQRNKRPISSDMVEIINMDAMIVGPETKGLVERVPTPEVIKTFEAEPIVIVGSEPREEAVVEIKESADMIEIIDIDAENNSCNFTPRPLPECQILTSTRSENSSKKKNKRQRKQREWSEPPMQIEPALDTVVVEAPEEQTDPSDPTATCNWASLTRRDSGSTEEMGKPDACIQSMHYFETKKSEANKENIPVDNQLVSDIISVGMASQLEEIEHLVEVEIPINRNQQDDGGTQSMASCEDLSSSSFSSTSRASLDARISPSASYSTDHMMLECAYMSHKWSIETFKDYPKNRYTIFRISNGAIFNPDHRSQMLDLMLKSNRPVVESSLYDPLCMLDTASKIVERMTVGRLDRGFRRMVGLAVRIPQRPLISLLNFIATAERAISDNGGFVRAPVLEKPTARFNQDAKSTTSSGADCNASVSSRGGTTSGSALTSAASSAKQFRTPQVPKRRLVNKTSGMSCPRIKTKLYQVNNENKDPQHQHQQPHQPQQQQSQQQIPYEPLQELADLKVECANKDKTLLEYEKHMEDMKAELQDAGEKYEVLLKKYAQAEERYQKDLEAMQQAMEEKNDKYQTEVEALQAELTNILKKNEDAMYEKTMLEEELRRKITLLMCELEKLQEQEEMMEKMKKLELATQQLDEKTEELNQALILKDKTVTELLALQHETDNKLKEAEAKVGTNLLERDR